MPRGSTQLGLPRRVVSCYLLFCTIAVAWLAVGVVVTANVILNSQTHTSCLTQIGRASSTIEIELLRDPPGQLDKLLDRLRVEGRLAYCAVADNNGTFISHTQRDLVGKSLPRQSGQLLQWGTVEGVRFVDAQGEVTHEYRAPLTAGGQPLGQLILATPGNSLWSTLSAAAQVAPWTIGVPLVLVCCGALVLRRMTQPLGPVHSQLATAATLPADAMPRLAAVTARDATSLGWNRVAAALAQLQAAVPARNVEDRLQEAASQRRQQSSYDVLESLAEGIAVTNAEGRITFANRALAALLDEQVGGERAMVDYLSAATDDAQSLLSLIEAPPTRPASAEVTRQAGEQQRVLRIARQPLTGATQRGCVWNFRDVTQQKLAEAMREQFIDSATHELRTPLANIKAYAETLASADIIDVEEQKEFCNIINSEATRLARFVDDLLCVSSMEVGSLSIHRQRVELQRLFDEVVDKVRPAMVKKSIDFQVALPAKLGEAQLDKDKLSAMLVNLLGNAAKYTPEDGTVTLQVTIADGRLEIAITDTGIGIAEHELQRVFEKFFRSADPRVADETGTGLGLPLAREIARLHGGDLVAESRLNHGSTFRAIIPLGEGAAT